MKMKRSIKKVERLIKRLRPDNITVNNKTYTPLEVAELIKVYNKAVQIAHYCSKKDTVKVSDLMDNGLRYMGMRAKI